LNTNFVSKSENKIIKQSNTKILNKKVNYGKQWIVKEAIEIEKMPLKLCMTFVKDGK
jgi:hypothetical protein